VNLPTIKTLLKLATVKIVIVICIKAVKDALFELPTIKCLLKFTAVDVILMVRVNTVKDGCLLFDLNKARFALQQSRGILASV